MHSFNSITYEPSITRGGYTDRVLHVDLSTSEIDIWKMPPDHKDKYVGGRGYALEAKIRSKSGITNLERTRIICKVKELFQSFLISRKQAHKLTQHNNTRNITAI